MTARPGLSPADSAALDGLRGLAALMVVASHASNIGVHLLPGFSLSGIGKPASSCSSPSVRFY